MSRLVLLEWDESELRAIDARATKHSATAHVAQSLEFPQSDDGPGNAVAELIVTAGLGRAEAIVLVGRSDCQLRTLTIPHAPADEMPEMVRFQAMRQYSGLSQDAAIDFVVLHESQDHGIEVLAATISPERLEQIRQIAQRANLNLSRIVLRPFATAALVGKAIGENDCHLIVDQTSRETDLTVIVGEKVITTRTVRLSTETPVEHHADLLAAEIRRTMAVVDNLDFDVKVGKVLWLGNPDKLEQSASRLSAEIGLPVEAMDPFTVPENHAHVKRQPEQPGRFAALLGAMRQHFTGETNRIDFLNPRRRTEDHSTKKRVAIYAVVGVLALIGVALAAYLPLRQMSNEIASLERTISDEDPAQKQAIQYSAEVKIVDDWVDNEVVWLDELYYVSYHLPPADRVIVNNMHFKYPPRSKNPTIVMTGRLKGSETVTELENSLRDEQLTHIASSKNLKPIVDPEKRYDHEVDETITIQKSKLKSKKSVGQTSRQSSAKPLETASGQDDEPASKGSDIDSAQKVPADSPDPDAQDENDTKDKSLDDSQAEPASQDSEDDSAAEDNDESEPKDDDSEPNEDDDSEANEDDDSEPNENDSDDLEVPESDDQA